MPNTVTLQLVQQVPLLASNKLEVHAAEQNKRNDHKECYYSTDDCMNDYFMNS